MSVEPLRVKIRPEVCSMSQNSFWGLFSTLVRDKNSHKNVIFHLFAENVPGNGFSRNLEYGKRSSRQRNQSWQIVCQCVQKGFDFTGGQFSIVSIRKWRRHYNSAALPRSLRKVSSIKLQFCRPTFTNSKAMQWRWSLTDADAFSWCGRQNEGDKGDDGEEAARQDEVDDVVQRLAA